MDAAVLRRYGILAGAVAAAVVAALIIGLTPPDGAAPAAVSSQTAAARVTPPAAESVWPPGTIAIRPAFGENVTVVEPGRKPIAIAVGTQVSALAAAPVNTPAANTLNAADSVTGELVKILPPARVEKLATVGGAPDSVMVAPSAAPDAGDLYVLDANSAVVTIVPPQGRIRRTVGVGDNPVSVGFAAGMALVLSRGSGAPGSPGSVTRITPSTVLDPIPTGPNSTSMAVTPDGSAEPGTAYVNNAGNGTLTIISSGGSSRTVRGLRFPTAVLLAPPLPDRDGQIYVIDGSTLRSASPTAAAMPAMPPPATRTCRGAR